MHTAPYFTAFGLLTIFHSWRVIRLRRKHRVALGDGGVAELARMIRIFGNFTEYVPMGLVLLIALEIVQAPTWFMHLCGITLLLGRILHAMGLQRSDLQPRVVGMYLTHTSLALASIGVMIWTFVGPLQ